MSKILNVVDLRKSYDSGGSQLIVLDAITFSVSAGTTFAMVGPSGSGKTTLLGLCAGLDVADSGSVELCGLALNSKSEDERASLRNQKVGFIFQNFQLLPTLTALENVSVPLELQGHKNAREIALDLLHQVGLAERTHHYPSQLSGGEQQRVAIARAFANNPEVLFADEPTGNLDTETGERIVNLLFQLNARAGTTLIIVTHDMDLARRCNNLLRLKGGQVDAELSQNQNA
ncbi:MAG: hypothetical protein RLZZ241_822 [Bacteroidota bacterium]